MNHNGPEMALFVKPWKHLSLQQMSSHVRHLGFDLIELPIRAGFPCEPDNIERDLPGVVKAFAAQGVRILNITADIPLHDERLYAACTEAGIHMNRVIFHRGNQNYWEAEADARRQLDSAIPFCERYGFQIGVQNHNGWALANNSMGLYHLIKDYDPKYVGAIWDPSHNALEGEAPEPGLEIVQSHLCVVNLKNAYWCRTSGPEAEFAQWEIYWTTGRQGRASWPRVAAKLKEIGYRGPFCLSAEYTATDEVDRLIVEDLALAKSIFLQKEAVEAAVNYG